MVPCAGIYLTLVVVLLLQLVNTVVYLQDTIGLSRLLSSSVLHNRSLSMVADFGVYHASV